jgi:PhnB protein
MRFMMIVKASKDSEAGIMPGEELIAAMTKYNEELVKAGVLLDLSGLQPSSKGARIKFSRGKTIVTDGPFAETKELIAGYWLIQVKSKEEAIEWARRIPAPHGGGQEAEVELRQVFELDDFGSCAAVDRARELEKGLAKTKPKGPAHAQIQPYLFFDGRCEEALDFYRRTLGAQVTGLMRFKDNPESCERGRIPPGAENKVLHASVTIGDTTVLASDGQCSGRPSFQGFSLSFTAHDAADAEQRFTALAEGGQVQLPLGKTFFAERFGMVADRFGVPWMIYVAP